jgi:hypothetical protein
MKPVVLAAAALGLVAGLGSTAAFAKANCKAYPKEEWIKAEDARARIEAQGYKINKFQVEGNCYEIYGRAPDGRRVEIYYDAKTLTPVKTEYAD